MNKDNRVRIRGDRLRERREKKGLSQTALAGRVGSTQRTISDYEQEKNFAVPGDIFVFICTETDTNPYYLLGLIDDPRPTAWVTPEWLSFIEGALNEGFGPSDCRKALDLLRLARSQT